MSDSQNQTENIKTTKKVTKPRKPRAEASSSKASTPNKLTSQKPKLVVMEGSEATSSKTAASSNKAAEKTVEEMYQKKTQLEHILLRPDTYVGSVEPVKEKMWVYDSEKQKIVYR